jgi:hypothetical protein
MGTVDNSVILVHSFNRTATCRLEMHQVPCELIWSNLLLLHGPCVKILSELIRSLNLQCFDLHQSESHSIAPVWMTSSGMWLQESSTDTGNSLLIGSVRCFRGFSRLLFLCPIQFVAVRKRNVVNSREVTDGCVLLKEIRKSASAS